MPYPLSQAARWDLTELPGTDSLFEANGCLRALEARFSALYGARDTLLSAGGATLCVQAMLAQLPPGSTLVCERGLHVSALNAMGLLDLRPVWVRGGRGADGIPRPPGPEAVREALRRTPQARAVYITSPNYYGCLADVAALAEAAHESGAWLIVDGAHGAHLPFLSPNRHPLTLGADLCCDSLHKTLPALTGAALLHAGRGVPGIPALPEAGRLRRGMSWFGSTSPSYLILLSCDLLARRLERGELPVKLRRCAERTVSLRRSLGGAALQQEGGEEKNSPWALDPMRLTLPLRTSGLTPDGLRRVLEDLGIEAELCDALGAVLLPGADLRERDWRRLRALPRALQGCWEPPSPLPALPAPPRAAMSIREAMLAPCETVPVEQARGRVAASMAAACPPGIPLAVYGEILDEDTTFLLKSSGINEVSVVK